jgi:hypothetical protein
MCPDHRPAPNAIISGRASLALQTLADNDKVEKHQYRAVFAATLTANRQRSLDKQPSCGHTQECNGCVPRDLQLEPFCGREAALLSGREPPPGEILSPKSGRRILQYGLFDNRIA